MNIIMIIILILAIWTLWGAFWCVYHDVWCAYNYKFSSIWWVGPYVWVTYGWHFFWDKTMKLSFEWILNTKRKPVLKEDRIDEIVSSTIRKWQKL